jgi:hypothetical protein
MLALLVLLGMATSGQAWWGGNPGGYPGGYWRHPGIGGWPAYGYAPYGNNRGYAGSDWSVKGVMNEWGDTHFVIEYHGNIYEDMGGGAWGRPQGYYGGYPGYGLPYRGNPYGGWR